MPTYITTIPQADRPTVIITLKQLVQSLPETLPYNVNVWLGDKIVRFGQTADNIIFFTDSTEEPSAEMMQYFDAIAQQFGKRATVMNQFRVLGYTMMRLYNEGRLIVDKETLSFTELPSRAAVNPVLTWDEVSSKLPETVPWNFPIYLTGGLAKYGWSSNDGDIIIFDEAARPFLPEIRKFFTNLIGWRFDVGQRVMTEREPVYLYKIYENGNLCHYS